MKPWLFLKEGLKKTILQGRNRKVGGEQAKERIALFFCVS